MRLLHCLWLVVLFMCLCVWVPRPGVQAVAKENQPADKNLALFSGQPPSPAATTALIVLQVQNADFTVRYLKYRVLFNKSEVKRIPLEGYDFKAAVGDEIATTLAEDKRMNWRLASNEDGPIDFTGIWDNKVAVPTLLKADRLLLVDVIEYGAFVPDLRSDKFYLYARMKLVDIKSGKKVWKKDFLEEFDLKEKVNKLQTDNQKGMKEATNKLIEVFCGKVKEKMRDAKL